MDKHLLIALYAAPMVVCYDNDNDAYIPEMWANESLMILEESVVMANLVHRDFSSEVANFGDVVNTRRPEKFYSSRKTDADEVVEEDAISTNVQVPLNQHHYKTFIIKDGEGSKSFMDLVNIYLRPAVQAVARGVDRSIAGQVHQFLGNGPTKRVGGLGTMSSSNVRDRIVDAAEILNVNNVPEMDRHLLISPYTKSYMLKTDLFTKVNESGTSEALRRAMVGDLFGFNIWSANNVPSSRSVNADVHTGTITNAASAGATGSQACSIAGYEVTAGEWAVVAGNDQPTYVTAATASTNTTAITLNEALKNATSAGAAVTVYDKCQVTADYALGYSKEISVDGWTKAPTVGRLFATGTGASRKVYTIIESRVDPANASNQLILLDRPLEAALSNNDNVFPGPAGDYNLAFHRNALALVTRPLALPPSATGVMSAVASYENFGCRITMQYDSKKEGTRCTVGMLSGVALLDANMGCLVLG